MPVESPGGESDPRLGNAFKSEFLDLLREQDEPFLSIEGETVGPWELRQEDGRFAMYRLWEGREHGDRPEATFRYRDAGLLFLAVWPAVGRDPIFRAGERGADGFAVECASSEVGHVRIFNDELFYAAHVAASIVRSPVALAALFEAAGPVVQEKAGQILARKLRRGGDGEHE